MALYSSGVRRADETAGLLTGALGLDGFTVDRALAEMRPGDGDGLTLDEVIRRFGDRWRREPYAPIAPGGEAWADFCTRAGRAVTDLADRHEGSLVAAVCHAGFIESTLIGLFGPPTFLPPPWNLDVGFTSLTIWARSDPTDAMPRCWRLERFNDIAHLIGISDLADRRRPVEPADVPAPQPLGPGEQP